MEKVLERFKIKGTERKIFKKKLKAERKKGFLPAIIYGHEFSPLPLFVFKKEFEKIYKKAGTSSLITLQVNEKKYNVLIHDVQVHPLTQEPEHIDFYKVKMTEKITAEVPLKFIGEAPAVKTLDAVIVKNFDKIEVECLPADLPHEIEVDLSSLINFDSVIYIKNLNIPSGVKVLADPEEAVVVVIPPRAEEIEEVVEEAVEEVAEEAPEEEKEETAEKEEKGE